MTVDRNNRAQNERKLTLNSEPVNAYNTTNLDGLAFILRTNPSKKIMVVFQKLAQFYGGSIRRLIGGTSGVGAIANYNGTSKKNPDAGRLKPKVNKIEKRLMNYPAASGGVSK